jgi:hypothetical protein
MKNVLTPLLRVLAFAAAASELSACVDTSPVDYHAPIVMDAGVADAALVNSDASRVAECRQCVTEDSCKAEWSKCTAEPRCEAFVGCLLDSYCMSFSSDLSMLPPCLLTCGAKAMLFSSDDPVVNLFRDVRECTTKKCAAPCGVTM